MKVNQMSRARVWRLVLTLLCVGVTGPAFWGGVLAQSQPKPPVVK